MPKKLNGGLVARHLWVIELKKEVDSAGIQMLSKVVIEDSSY